MDAMEAYADIVSLCADTNQCPHAVLPHVSEVEGMDALTDNLIGVFADAVNLFLTGQDDGTSLGNMLSHALIIMAGIGYTFGASNAYDVVLTSDVVVPDSLAALDFVEPLDGPGAA